MKFTVDDGSAVCRAMGKAARRYINATAERLGISLAELAEMERGTEVREGRQLHSYMGEVRNGRRKARS
jgi:hypothetical protein